MIKKVIACYSGRFQPMGRHHVEAFKWLQNKFGKENTYICSSDKVELPKSPLNFKEKKLIASKYGIADRMVQVKNPYRAEEITQKFDPKDTALVFMVGEKDMREDPRFKIGMKKDGSPGYFQRYVDTKNMVGFDKHGYLIVAPHVSYEIPGIGEMSGTNIRKALSNPKFTKDQFEGIFGWYDPKIEKMLKDKFSPKKTKELSEILQERALNRLTLIELLLEGGAAGHMAHPFDIPSVKTGKDLLYVFEETSKYLQNNEVPVKIDGINSSIRLVNLKGKQQFVLDRGSNKPLDVKGVTSKDLIDRFGEGHGMTKIGAQVLKIFNEALPSIKKDLDKLGMTKNPNMMLNIEYVEGQSNVQKYDKNFLVIHNVLEMKQVTPTKRQSEEASYSKDALQSLIKNLTPTAKKYDFEVFNVIPAKQKASSNFSSELSKTYTVVINDKKKETMSLDAWLDQAQNTKGQKLKLKNGKTVDALSKQVYMWIDKGNPVEDLVADPKDIKLAIDSFVIYLATIKLGDAVLRSMTSPLGDVNEQEGIVVRNKKIYSSPYKITGSFITRGLESSFQK